MVPKTGTKIDRRYTQREKGYIADILVRRNWNTQKTRSVANRNVPICHYSICATFFLDYESWYTKNNVVLVKYCPSWKAFPRRKLAWKPHRLLSDSLLFGPRERETIQVTCKEEDPEDTVLFQTGLRIHSIELWIGREKVQIRPQGNMVKRQGQILDKDHASIKSKRFPFKADGPQERASPIVYGTTEWV